MASVIFNSALNDVLRGNIDFDSDAFKVMLVTSGYVPHKDTHARRSDVVNEVVGIGYANGGVPTPVAVRDTANDRIETSLGEAIWTASSITARGAVYYKSRGGMASADELVAYIDFAGDVVSTNGTFSLSESILRIQN